MGRSSCSIPASRGIPVINVENACASAMTALRGAWLEVASGAADVALAVGVEKMFVGDTARTIGALSAVSELDLSQMGMQFTTSYAIHPKINLKAKMRDYGWTSADFAKPAVKNSFNGSLNPLAQHRRPLSIEEVVQSRIVVDPLTLLDVRVDFGRRSRRGGVRGGSRGAFHRQDPDPHRQLRAAVGRLSPADDDRPDSAATSAAAAYAQAGIGPDELDAIELHDAMAPAELMLYERLGLCAPGEGPKLIDDGTTTLRGRVPVNPSGGLCSRGHPVGATGFCRLPSSSGRCAARPTADRSSRARKSRWRKIRADCCWGRTRPSYGVTILKSLNADCNCKSEGNSEQEAQGSRFIDQGRSGQDYAMA